MAIVPTLPVVKVHFACIDNHIAWGYETQAIFTSYSIRDIVVVDKVL